MGDDIKVLSSNLIRLFEEKAETKELAKGDIILREGDYIKRLPIVITGLIKVYRSFKEKEILLYYIKPGDTCIMSFIASLKGSPSVINAVAEEDTQSLFIPSDYFISLSKEYSNVNEYLFFQFYERYSDILDTMNNVLFNKIDEKLYNYLRRLANFSNEKIIKKTHEQIASELGTSREVITRAVRKLAEEGKIISNRNYIKLI